MSIEAVYNSLSVYNSPSYLVLITVPYLLCCCHIVSIYKIPRGQMCLALLISQCTHAIQKYA
uniref:Uncharacterized protein n=1 Tax=Anguilla anguilla TaxID=7936 RepID=A0A0E9XW15_ANGAN